MTSIGRKSKWSNPEYCRSYHRKWYAEKRKKMTDEEKEKRRESKRAAYYKHKDRILGKIKQSYKNNKEKYSVSSKKYYQKNREKILLKAKENRGKNRERRAVWQKAYNIKRREALRDYALRRTYGISSQEYEKILALQMGTCANRFCPHDGKEDKRGKLFVDHCHKTNLVRGLLCNRCNRTLGMLKESGDLIRGLANYIEGSAR